MIVLAVIWLGPTVSSVMLAIAGTLVLIFISIRRFTHTEGSHRPAAADSHRLKDEIWRFSRPLIPVALLLWITGVSDRYIIEWLSRDAAKVGMYAAGYGLISQPFIMTNSILGQTLRPIYFTAIATGNRSHARRVFGIWLMIAGCICIGGAALAYMLRNVLVKVFLASQYAGAAPIIPWIAVGYIFYVLQQALEQNLIAHRRTMAVLVCQSVGAFASIAATVPLVLKFGMIGAAYACPIYFLMQAATNLLLILTGPTEEGGSDPSIAAPQTSTALERVNTAAAVERTRPQMDPAQNLNVIYVGDMQPGGTSLQPWKPCSRSGIG